MIGEDLEIWGFTKRWINCKIINHLALHISFAFLLPTLGCGRCENEYTGLIVT